MLSAFVKDETGAIVIAYGVFALGLTAAIVSMAGMVGTVLDHSYSAIPDDAIALVPSIEGLSQAAGYLDGSSLGETIGRNVGGL